MSLFFTQLSKVNTVEPPTKSHQRIWILVMASQVSIVIHSLTSSVCLGEKMVVTKSQSKQLKEMERREQELCFFSRKKLSLFIHRLGFNISTLKSFLRIVSPLSKAPYDSSVCVLTDEQWIGLVHCTKIVQFTTWSPLKAVRCMTTLSTKTLPCGFCGQAIS